VFSCFRRCIGDGHSVESLRAACDLTQQPYSSSCFRVFVAALDARRSAVAFALLGVLRYKTCSSSCLRAFVVAFGGRYSRTGFGRAFAARIRFRSRMLVGVISTSSSSLMN
jgi:hypothetical protein